MQKTPIIGAHLSVAKGIPHTIDEIILMGGNALQIFSGSPRSWERKPINPVELEKIKTYAKEKQFDAIITHALYLVNLASPNVALVKKSIEMLKYDLEYTQRLGGLGVVVHLGSHLGLGFPEVAPQLVETLQEILSHAPEGSLLMIENSAGQKGKIASAFDELHYLLDELSEFTKQGKLGWCFDTCHGFAAGYELERLDETMREWGLVETLRAIHVNDSKDPFGSGRDRHENLGDGMIGKQLMASCLQTKAFAGLPMILEVPGIDGNGPDGENMCRLREYLGL